VRVHALTLAFAVRLRGPRGPPEEAGPPLRRGPRGALGPADLPEAVISNPVYPKKTKIVSENRGRPKKSLLKPDP
jgi:hypothetical protein